MGCSTDSEQLNIGIIGEQVYYWGFSWPTNKKTADEENLIGDFYRF